MISALFFRFVPNPHPGVWGIRVPKSEVEDTEFEYTGMVGSVASGELDTSVAGITTSVWLASFFTVMALSRPSSAGLAVTQERSSAVDFPGSFVSAHSTAFLQRPDSAAALQGAYTSEFEASRLNTVSFPYIFFCRLFKSVFSGKSGPA